MAFLPEGPSHILNEVIKLSLAAMRVIKLVNMPKVGIRIDLAGSRGVRPDFEKIGGPG